MPIGAWDGLTAGSSTSSGTQSLTWSGNTYFGATAGPNISDPPDPDALDFSGIDLAALTSGADFVAFSFSAQIGVRSNALGGAWPGINIFDPGGLAAARDTSGGTLALNGEDTSPAPFTDASDEILYGPLVALNPGGYLINPSPQTWPGMDSGDATTDVLWTPAQAQAAVVDYYVQLQDGTVAAMGTRVPGHTFHDWSVSFAAYTIIDLGSPSNLMCVL